ncbi:hypothetical protein B7463_g8086, partial [Scytalidium lignicola]
MAEGFSMLLPYSVGGSEVETFVIEIIGFAWIMSHLHKCQEQGTSQQNGGVVRRMEWPGQGARVPHGICCQGTKQSVESKSGSEADINLTTGSVKNVQYSSQPPTEPTLLQHSTGLPAADKASDALDAASASEQTTPVRPTTDHGIPTVTRPWTAIISTSTTILHQDSPAALHNARLQPQLQRLQQLQLLYRNLLYCGSTAPVIIALPARSRAAIELSLAAPATCHSAAAKPQHPAHTWVPRPSTSELLPSTPRPETATIPSAHSLAAILSPPDPTLRASDPELTRPPSSYINIAGPNPNPNLNPNRAAAESTTYSQAEPSYLHPNSPQLNPHRATLASSGGPAPIVFGGAGGGTDDARGGEGRGGLEEKKPTKMVRSSIACARCRRSKVRCINNGVNSVCKACQSSGRECTYPPSAAATTPRRTDNTVIKTEGEGEGKKRVRVKTEDPGRSIGHRIDEDVLDPKILTRSVWDDIYKLFRAHFSAEMPFLHPPTFRKRIFQISNPREAGPPAPIDQDGRLLFLGVLTLTARFHPALVAHHSPKTASGSSNPQAASEYYSRALATAFGPSCENLTRPTLETVQALLMLGLYEWSQSRGLQAWVYIGIALRLALSMGLAFEDDADRTSPRKVQGHAPDENYAIEKECRRRTFWSCFIMDRMLSSGKFRPTMIDVKTLRVRLPCSDDQFMFGGNRVKTSFLIEQRLGYESSNDLDSAELNDEGVENRFIRLVEIFGRFSIYSHAGGRRTEKYPPWDERTEFYQLRRDLEHFHRSLPSKLTYTQANLAAHIEMPTTAATYASLHTLYFLCLIMLHREYIPFIPLRCDGPQGPLDEPTFPKDKFDVPEGFWEVSAETIFKAAKDLVDIVRTYQDRGALPESPVVGFCVWQAAFVSLYAVHFSHMDVHRHLCDPAHDLDMVDGDAQNMGYAAITVKLLKELAPKSRMAAGYLRIVGKMHRYFNVVRSDYHNQFKHKARPWTGGGLEEYKTLERELKEFGSIEGGGDKSIPSDASDTADPIRSRASTNEIGSGSNNSSGEAMQGVVEGATPSRAWAAVNSTQMETTDRTKFVGQNHSHTQGPPPGGYDYSSSYQLSPRQTPPHPPSLVSGGSTADSPSGLSSPYGTHQMFHSQQAGQPQLSHPQSSGYPAMAPHTQPLHHPGQPAMAPPQGTLVAVPPDFFPPNNNQNVQGKEEMYWCQQESINYNSNLDNMAQMPVDMDTWPQGEWSGDNPNFLQVIASSPKFAFAN